LELLEERQRAIDTAEIVFWRTREKREDIIVCHFDFEMKKRRDIRRQVVSFRRKQRSGNIQIVEIEVWLGEGEVQNI
jgi:hypothetical protein